jgi:hypothetical protein
MYDPYNNSRYPPCSCLLSLHCPPPPSASASLDDLAHLVRPFKPWGGEDCSYLHAYAAAPAHGLNLFVMLGMMAVSIALQQLVAEDDRDGDRDNRCGQQEKEKLEKERLVGAQRRRVGSDVCL